jgi:hypothetical protein
MTATVTVTVTYTAEGLPDTVMSFPMTGMSIEDIEKELPLKKKELDAKFNVDSHKSSIKMDDSSMRETE